MPRIKCRPSFLVRLCPFLGRAHGRDPDRHGSASHSTTSTTSTTSTRMDDRGGHLSVIQWLGGGITSRFDVF